MLSSCDTAEDTYAAGKALEDLMVYVFEKLPGIELYDRNILDHPLRMSSTSRSGTSRRSRWLAFWIQRLLLNARTLVARLAVTMWGGSYESYRTAELT